jgi:hypothetical protein
LERSGKSCFVYETPLIDSLPAKKEAERRQTQGLLPARKRRAGRATEKGGLRRPPLAGALACRRSTAVLTSGTFVPKAQRRARLPENGAKRCGLAADAASVTAKHLARRHSVAVQKSASFLPHTRHADF